GAPTPPPPVPARFPRERTRAFRATDFPVRLLQASERAPLYPISRSEPAALGRHQEARQAARIRPSRRSINRGFLEHRRLHDRTSQDRADRPARLLDPLRSAGQHKTARPLPAACSPAALPCPYSLR